MMVNKKIGFVMIILLLSIICSSNIINGIDDKSVENVDKKNLTQLDLFIREGMSNFLFFHFKIVNKIYQENINKKEMIRKDKIYQTIEDNKKKFIENIKSNRELKTINFKCGDFVKERK